MTVYRYPFNRILGDYLLGGSGAAMSGGLTALAPTIPFVLIFFGGLTGLFLLYTIRTAIRHRLRVAADAKGIRVTGGWVRSLKWDEVEGVRLRYYSTRRNRKNGWMTLKLHAGHRGLAVDSYLDGFEVLARRAAEAARERHLELDPATYSNFAALEIAFKDPAP